MVQWIETAIAWLVIISFIMLCGAVLLHARRRACYLRTLSPEERAKEREADNFPIL